MRAIAESVCSAMLSATTWVLRVREQLHDVEHRAHLVWKENRRIASPMGPPILEVVSGKLTAIRTRSRESDNMPVPGRARQMNSEPVEAAVAAATAGTIFKIATL